MKSLKVAFLDPAESNDPAAVVAVQGTYPAKKIYVRAAKQFTQNKLIRKSKIAEYLILLDNNVNLDWMGIERNKQGNEFYEYFKIKYDLTLHRVSTSGGLTEKTKVLGHSLDKRYMMGWLKLQKNNHNVIFPSTADADMRELIDQVPKIVNIGTPERSVQKAFRSQHDDLFISLLHDCNVIRLWWDREDMNK